MWSELLSFELTTVNRLSPKMKILLIPFFLIHRRHSTDREIALMMLMAYLSYMIAEVQSMNTSPWFILTHQHVFECTHIPTHTHPYNLFSDICLFRAGADLEKI